MGRKRKELLLDAGVAAVEVMTEGFTEVFVCGEEKVIGPHVDAILLDLIQETPEVFQVLFANGGGIEIDSNSSLFQAFKTGPAAELKGEFFRGEYLKDEDFMAAKPGVLESFCGCGPVTEAVGEEDEHAAPFEAAGKIEEAGTEPGFSLGVNLAEYLQE